MTPVCAPCHPCAGVKQKWGHGRSVPGPAGQEGADSSRAEGANPRTGQRHWSPERGSMSPRVVRWLPTQAAVAEGSDLRPRPPGPRRRLPSPWAGSRPFSRVSLHHGP